VYLLPVILVLALFVAVVVCCPALLRVGDLGAVFGRLKRVVTWFRMSFTVAEAVVAVLLLALVILVAMKTIL
jgi:hypothetical protein